MWLSRALGDGLAVERGQEGSPPHNEGQGGSVESKLCQEPKMKLADVHPGFVHYLGADTVGGGDGGGGFEQKRVFPVGWVLPAAGK